MVRVLPLIFFFLKSADLRFTYKTPTEKEDNVNNNRFYTHQSILDSKILRCGRE